MARTIYEWKNDSEGGRIASFGRVMEDTDRLTDLINKDNRFAQRITRHSEEREGGSGDLLDSRLKHIYDKFLMALQEAIKVGLFLR